jgi:hypothetical protein
MTEKNDNINTAKPLSKRIGKTVLFYSVIISCLSFILSKTIPSEIFRELMIDVFTVSVLVDVICYALLFGNNCGNSNYCGPQSMSILDARNPAGPNYWNRR